MSGHVFDKHSVDGHNPKITHKQALVMGRGGYELIPESRDYCYDHRAPDVTEVRRPHKDIEMLEQATRPEPTMQIHGLCPFWGRDDRLGGYGQGICTLLGEKDQNPHGNGGMLWDMLRICPSKGKPG